ncbi:hypothetical protein [Kutzneria buriramensis]|uniref:Uncharacterized protein n=1 Tax=Kutzneria buriramensis TaxID=1045776 RepID=A0A3E0HPC4_9PSEU|nr:hypothetical protein [Kutzneria buriramensis]REH48279.1 hypothetical protein BCF44_105137 [Kutzneria buriramensis]
MIKRTYTEFDVRRDAAWPSGFAPEDHMPAEIRRAERLRARETGYRLAESLIAHGAPVDVAALLMPVPYEERSPERRWTVRVEEATLAGDTRRCSMPVRGCRRHGDTLEWRYGGWRCRVAKCQGYQYAKRQRRHCDQPRVAVIDYPSGHRRRVCAGHLASERAVWAEAAEDVTIRVTQCRVAGEAAGVIG